MRLRRAQDRLELLDAIAAGQERRDEVLRLVAGSPSVDEARKALMRLLGVGERGATAVLDMQIRRLTPGERQRVLDEAIELRAEIGGLGG